MGITITGQEIAWSVQYAVLLDSILHSIKVFYCNVKTAEICCCSVSHELINSGSKALLSTVQLLLLTNYIFLHHRNMERDRLSVLVKLN